MFLISGRTKYTNNTFSEICNSLVSYQHWKKQSAMISTLHLKLNMQETPYRQPPLDSHSSYLLPVQNSRSPHRN